MSSRISAPRGTRDRLPEDAAGWAHLEALAADLAGRYALDRVDIPLFEQAELYVRGLGESSDAVDKEMFRVGGAHGSGEEVPAWALRPEPTAGIMRAYVEHGMHVRPGPLRLWLLGPMFRYDRPQAGRYRQFSQWDVEVVGDPGPAVDAELIELCARYLAEAGVGAIAIHLNSIGDATCRPGYRAALTAYLEQYRDRLGPDSQRRLATNPLRVLDDRALDPAIAADAPKSVDHLCDACAAHFAAVRQLLDDLGVAYELDHRLVRGLDYYTRTTFEVFPAGREGSQDALAGGGRYDGLVGLLGGPATPGIGFGVGLDRVLAALPPDAAIPAAAPLVAVLGGSVGERLRVAGVLRATGRRVRADGSTRKLGRQLESADKLGARWAVILPDAPSETVVLRDLGDGSQREVALADVAAATMHRS